MTEYTGTVLKSDISISKLYTVHYFEYSRNYQFSGESHDFWEMVYVDKGEVIVTSEESKYILKQGEVIFHKPNEWHTINSDGVTAPNVAIVSFDSKSAGMDFFKNKILKVGQNQKSIISKIISEYTNAFITPFNDPYTNKLVRKPDQLIGSEQLLKMYLCELLISFIRNNTPSSQYSTINVNQSIATLNLLITYMQDRLNTNVTVDELVKYSGLNRTGINTLFKRNLNMSVIEYFIHMKVDAAKKYLREDNYNVTQISEILGYSNIHYFSRQFKKITGMSPIEYSTSIKALVNKL